MTHLQNHFTRVDDFDVGLSSDGQTSPFLRSAVHGGLRLDLVVVAVGLAGAVRKLRRGYEDKELFYAIVILLVVSIIMIHYH